MFTWRHILQPIPVTLPFEATVQDVLHQITKNRAELVLILKDGRVVGYVN